MHAADHGAGIPNSPSKPKAVATGSSSQLSWGGLDSPRSTIESRASGAETAWSQATLAARPESVKPERVSCAPSRPPSA